jgi:hypothetical protein
MVVMVIAATFTNGGHIYGFVSNVGDLRSNSIGLLAYGDMHTYLGHQCCIIGPSG